MKKTSKIIIALAMLLSAVSMQAQDNKQRMSREQMTETQAKHIAADLNLSSSVYDKFVTTYVNYKKELWAIAPKKDKQKGKKKQSETDEEAAERMRQRFERSQKTLDIRDKYYKEFSKFLTQRQIEQMYDKERKMMQRFKKRHDDKAKRHDGKRRPGEEKK